jgi:hypothetical protein
MGLKNDKAFSVNRFAGMMFFSRVYHLLPPHFDKLSAPPVRFAPNPHTGTMWDRDTFYVNQM